MSFLRSWRYLLLSMVAIGALVAFAACGGDDEGGGGETTAPTDAPAAGERIEGGDLVIQGNEPASLDPHFSSFAQDISLHRMVFRGLYWLNTENEPTPMMAESDPEISADGTTYTITLRDGLVWSDGDDLTADDFVLGIHRTCNPIHGGEYEYVLVNIVGCDDHFTNEAGFDQAMEDAIGVEAVDPLTLEVTLIEPQPTFTIILSLWMTFPVPSHLLPNSSDDWPAGPSAPDQLAYNGPYMMTEFEPQDHHTLVPNPEWGAFNDVETTLDSITVRYIDDLSQAANAYRTGELQASDTDLTQLEALVGEFGEGEEYFKFLAPSTRGLEMNLEKPPLDQLEVRLALAQAIDRPNLVKVVTQGGNEVTTSWVPEVTGGHPTDEFDDTIGFDPASAKEHLTAAGFPNGEGFPTLEILVGDSPTAKATGEFLKSSLETHLGITTTVTVVDSATRSDRFTNENFELFPGGWIQDYPDPENWIIGQFDTPGSLNHFNCSDPDIDALIADARFNTNDTERRDQYAQVNELIVTRVCGIAPYWHENNHWLRKPEIAGISENMTGQDASMGGDWFAESWGFTE